MRIAVIGGGWAGLAAAVEATTAGHEVTLFEMAAVAGGRARRLPQGLPGLALDNGQHILIGAYAQTLELLRRCGVEEAQVLHRMPLRLLDARGRGLSLPPGAAMPAFVRGVLSASGFRWSERIALLRMATGWLLSGFRCNPSLSVAQLTARTPAAVRRHLIDPLCVAALNTPSAQASASVFLRVLRDALFSGPGASDLLLPRVDLGTLWPDAASQWLVGHGAQLRLGQRVMALEPGPGGWRVDDEPFDAAVLASSALEAARLAHAHAPQWADVAQALQYEPIVTVLVYAPAMKRLPAPIVALDADDAHPAQYAFDLQQLRDGGATDTLAFVISGARSWTDRGLDATAEAVLAQARGELGLGPDARVLRTLSEKRATFLCTPGLVRPAARIAARLYAAGDYVDGPYPATLEGAVRSGVAAARALTHDA